MFLSTRKRNAGVVKFFGFEELFKKLRFLDGLAWTVGLTVEDCFLILSSVLRAGPWSVVVHFSDALYMYDFPKH